MEFVALVDALGCQKRKVQDLLEEGKLWSLLQQEAEKLHKSLDLASFFDHCKRGMRSPEALSPVPHVAVAPKGKRDFFFVVFLCLTKICSSFDS